MIRLQLLAFLTFICVKFCFSQQNQGRIDTAMYYDFVEQMPTYKGDMNFETLSADLMKGVKRSCLIPADSSKILVHFIVETNGSVQKAVIRKGICDEMNDRTIALLRDMKFQPGKQNGKLVRVKGAVILKF